MNFRDIKRIVNFKPLQNRFGINVYLTTNGTNNSSGPEFNIIRGSSYTNHASEDRITKIMHIILINYLPFVYHLLVIE